MTRMLSLVVMQSVAAAGVIVLLASMYVQSVNASMDDCYHINRLLNAFVAETDAFDAYVLYQYSSSLDTWETACKETDAAYAQINITYEKSKEQFLLIGAVGTSLTSFRQACDTALSLRQSDEDYAKSYAKTIQIGDYIEVYIRELLQNAVSQGQEIYHRELNAFRWVPVLFVISTTLTVLGIVIWTRWIIKRVVKPIRDLMQMAGSMSKNQYDVPDLETDEEDELAQLSRQFNKMKRSTQDLVESLKERNEMENKLYEEAMQRMKMEKAMDDLRLSLLQSQINPHFLFNTLNIISRMALIEEAPATEELIKRLSNLFRYNLQSVEDIVPLSSEVKIVSDYMAIQRIRFGDRIQFELEVAQEAQDARVPVFTMQPLIENAVIHGVSPLEEGGVVRVKVTIDGDNLKIVVSDTGKGIPQEKLAQLMDSAFNPGHHVSGIGVGNVRARIMAFDPKSTFTIHSVQGEGTKVEMIIPLIREEQSHV